MALARSANVGSDPTPCQRQTQTERSRAVFRIESPRLIAGLARIVRDVGLAEELAQDALVAALEKWPESGVPGQPGRVADGDGEDTARSTSCAAASCSTAKHEELGHELDERERRTP